MYPFVNPRTSGAAVVPARSCSAINGATAACIASRVARTPRSPAISPGSTAAGTPGRASESSLQVYGVPTVPLKLAPPRAPLVAVRGAPATGRKMRNERASGCEVAASVFQRSRARGVVWGCFCPAARGAAQSRATVAQERYLKSLKSMISGITKPRLPLCH
jgi:hypothetical protein